MALLPDVLEHGLKVVFCGSAAGAASAKAGAYYAGPGNRFWEVLFRTGLTPYRLAPHEFRRVLEFGIGLTDLAKGESGADAELSPGAYDAALLRAKVLAFAPVAVAFNGKKPARGYLGGGAVDYGLHDEAIGRTALFVLPSTSGAARRFWDEGRWRELARYLRSHALAGLARSPILRPL